MSDRQFQPLGKLWEGKLELLSHSIRYSSHTGSSALELWDDLLPLFQRCSYRGKASPEDNRLSLKNERSVVWIAREGEQITFMIYGEFTDSSEGRIFHIRKAGGKRMRENWHLAHPLFRSWLNLNGCILVRAICGDGVKRMLESVGFRKTANVVEFDLLERKGNA